jgi:hypothetical protein
MTKCRIAYDNEFNKLGYAGFVAWGEYWPHTPSLQIADGPSAPEKTTGLINLILTFEPEQLGILIDSLPDIEFLSVLTSLRELNLCADVKDLTPLKGLTNLSYLSLGCDQLNDLTPLKGLTHLSYFELWCAKVPDLTPLQGLTNLKQLIVKNASVTDLRPLEGMSIRIER